MRVLVIGGTRFMGPRAIRRLLDAGHSVTAFHRGPAPGNLPEGVQHIFGDRHSLAEHAGSLRTVQPDVILDMMLITESDARGLLGVFRGISARIVAISSCDVYRNYGGLLGSEQGDPDPAPLAEDSRLRSHLYPYRGDAPRAADDPARHLDDYDKILVERTLQGQPDLPVTILRLPMVYGPGDYQHRVRPHLQAMDAGKTEIVLPQSEAGFRCSRGYVDNVAAAIALAVTDPRTSGVYNVADEPTLDEADWVRAVGKAADWSGRVTVAPDDLSRGGDDNTDYRCHLDVDAGRIRRELSYTQPVSLEDALHETIAWERANP